MYDVTHHESYKVASDWIKATNMVSRQNDNAVFLASRECSVFNTKQWPYISGQCPIGRAFNFSFFFNTEISPVEFRRCRDAVGRKQD